MAPHIARRPLAFSIFATRFLSVLLAIVFIPLCAAPLGFANMILGMFGAICFSAVWNLFSLFHYGLTSRQPAYPLVLLLDIMVFPAVLIIFALVAHSDGIDGHKHVEASEWRVTAAFVIFLSAGILHVVTFFLSGSLLLSSGNASFGANRPPPTLTQNPRSCHVKSPAGPSNPCRQATTVRMSFIRPISPRRCRPIDVESLLSVTPPSDAYMKQRATETRPSSTSVRPELLPQYSPVDQAHPPPYELPKEPGVLEEA